MSLVMNDLNIRIGTVNGTGSQSSNQIIIKSLFRMGIPVSGKNLFPSNIYGLPTWFHIRVNEQGFTSFSENLNIVIAMNKDSIAKDIEMLDDGGLFIYNADLKFDTVLLNEKHINFGIPFKELVTPISSSIKLRKLLTNMIYVGALAQIIKIDREVLGEVVGEFFKSKQSVVDINLAAINAGYDYAAENFKEDFSYQVRKSDRLNNKILIDGNTAGAIGSVFGGCSFASWYPITPSSSIMESFEDYANQYRVDKNGKKNFAVLQAEDELSSIGMVIGAGWTGARAMTATSGPGMSLMSEFVGLSYFSEVPAVIWNIQRVGPSTGLPTRTQQGDLRISHTMGHGDGKHPVLIPKDPTECFDFAGKAFDIAEQMQSFVCVLSDLDIGMNQWISNEFAYPKESLKRGKVLNEEDLEKVASFKRYEDVDGDSVPYRTLPGTHSDKAAYFTRGTGHNLDSSYTEDNLVYEKLMDRLAKKEIEVKKFLPKPLLEHKGDNAKIGLIAYGSTHQAMNELIAKLKHDGLEVDYLRVRALPLTDDVNEFVSKYDKVFVIDQNRDGQMTEFVQTTYPMMASKVSAVKSYDGLPVRAYDLHKKIKTSL